MLRLESEVAFQLRWGGYCTPPGPLPCAEARASAILALEARGDIILHVEDEEEPYDGEDEPPKYLLWLAVYQDETGERTPLGRPLGFPLASIGMVGVESRTDPYLRTLWGELAIEALGYLTSAQNGRDAAMASELAGRATYAAGAPL